MDLFQRSAEARRVHQPLAERLRPQALEDFLGQTHLLGTGKWLSQFGNGDSMPSFIFWGPPGSGKTTLARILASKSKAKMDALSAVSAGVKDIREIASRAGQRRDHYGERTLLFLDEIHRFTKAQQDALLPHVEAGVLTLIGATTENPSFHVNAALLSRARVLRMEALSDLDIEKIIATALSDTGRGLGHYGLTLEVDANVSLIRISQGDARRALSVLEVAAELASQREEHHITRVDVEEAAQNKTLLYDKSGDEHYGVVSAFIKSMRGSDPDATVYWMTRMLEAGEDPLFVLRRLVIFASEDVGNADPMALSVATSALASYRMVGMPEGALPMTQAAIYLACAAKSNVALTAYANARALVREHGSLPVPAKLRNASSALGRELGHGKGYRYPHDFEGHYITENYLPEELNDLPIVTLSNSGHENEMKQRQDSLSKK